MGTGNLLSKLKQSQLFKDSFWSLSGNVVGRGLSLLAGIIVARYLGKDIYGEYGIIKNTILTIGVFSTFGLGYTATKYIADFRQNAIEKIPIFIKYANRITLMFSGSMALLLFAFADVVAIKWLEAGHLATPLRILSVLIVFNAITTTQIGILSGFGLFKEIAKINSWIGLVTFLLSVVMTYFFNLNGALMALLVVQVLNCFFNYKVVKKWTPAKTEEKVKDKVLQLEIVRFSTPIALQEAFFSVTGWFSSLLLIRFASYGDLGMYSAAMQWNSVILFIPGILRNVILTHLSESSNDKNAHNKILKQTRLINFVSTLIPTIIIFFISGLIAKTYGESFKGLEVIISLAVFSTIFSSISNVYAQAFTSLGKNWHMLILRTLRDFSILLGFVVCLKVFSINGALSMIVSNLVFGIIFMLLMIFTYNKLKNYD